MVRKGLLALLLVLVGTPVGLYFYFKPKLGDDTPVEEKKLARLPADLSNALACLPVMPGQGFPGTLPWRPLRVIGEEKVETLEDIARDRPIEFLEICLHRYERHVQTCRFTFIKQERIKGDLRKRETILVNFREKPFSVHMTWKENAFLVVRSLFVKGENKDEGLARPIIEFLPITSFPVDGTQAKSTSRYGIHQCGIGFALSRALASMREAKEAGTLHVRYEGLVTLKEVGDRPCYKFVRTPHVPPEEEGVDELTLYFDEETLLQVGSVLRDVKKNLIAEYFFRDIEINPTFDENQFTRKAL